MARSMSTRFKTMATFAGGLGLIMVVGVTPAAARGGKKATATELTTKTT